MSQSKELFLTFRDAPKVSEGEKLHSLPLQGFEQDLYAELVRDDFLKEDFKQSQNQMNPDVPP